MRRHTCLSARLQSASRVCGDGREISHRIPLDSRPFRTRSVAHKRAKLGMRARAWAAFCAKSVVWGLPYFCIKIAVDELSPAFVAWSLSVLAVAILLPPSR
jgi:hypothetical protein